MRDSVRGRGRDAVQPLLQQPALPGRDGVGVGVGRPQRDGGPDRARRRDRGRVGDDGGQHGLAGQPGHRRIGRRRRQQGQHRAAGRGVHERHRLLLGDPEPADRGDPPDERTQHRRRARRRRRGSPGPGVAVHQRVQARVGQPEADVQVPPRPQVGDRVGARDPLVGQVGLEPVLGDGVEQPHLVAEQPVDRGRLDARRGGHRAGGDGLPPAPGQQLGRRLDDPFPRRVPHVANVNRYQLPLIT